MMSKLYGLVVRWLFVPKNGIKMQFLGVVGFKSSTLTVHCLKSTVRLRFRKSIAGHHFQNTRKLANNDFQYHRDIIYSVYQYSLTKKNVFYLI